jgi:protein O-mannosyl-transferase
VWAPIVLVALGALVYANSLHDPFVFDDLKWIRHSRIGSLWPLANAFGSSSRPVLNLTLAMNYAIGGLDPLGYHLFNLAVHLSSGLVLYGLVRRTLRGRRLHARYAEAADGLALCAALLWLVHPLATQAVTYVVQRAESLSALCILLTLYCTLRSSESARRVAWQAAAVASCAVGMATKETVVVAPILALLYDRCCVAGSAAKALRARGGLYVGLACTWLVLWLHLDSNALEGKAAWAGFGLDGLGVLAYARSQPGVILHYLRLVFWPHPLVLDYGWPVASTPLAILAPTALLGALAGATLWALRRAPPLGFLGACFFLLLAPTSSLLPIVDLAFEHRMYLPSAVVALLAVLGVHALLRRAAAPVWLGGVLCAAVAVPLAATTVARNRDYRSAEAIWRSVVSGAPENPRGHLNLGVALFEEHRYAESLASLEHGAALDPEDAAIQSSLGATLIGMGRLDDAAEHLRRAIALNSGQADAQRNLGYVQEQRGELRAAYQRYAVAARLDPGDALARVNLANILLKRRQFDAALAQFRSALEIDPRLARALAGAAWVLCRHPDASRRNPAQAIGLAERAVSLRDAGDVVPLITLAEAYAAAGQRARALEVNETALAEALASGHSAAAESVRDQRARLR